MDVADGGAAMSAIAPAAAAPVDLAALEQAADSGDEAARIALANQWLARNRHGTPEHQRGLDLMLAAAEGSRWREASWCLGAYYLQVTTWPDAHAQAARWLTRAAAAGVAPAIDRLATLYLQGLGVDFDPARAHRLQSHLADAGFQQAAWEAGYLLADAGEDARAAAAFTRACALGYPPAYYSLGLRMAGADAAQRDPAFARALLLRAADAGFPDARQAADDYVPAAICGDAADAWHRRLKDNLAAARPILQQLVPGDIPLTRSSLHPLVTRLEGHFASLGHPSITLGADGRVRALAAACGRVRAAPGPLEWLAQQPRIAICRHLATREECAHLMHKVAPSLRRADGYLKQDSANDASEGRQFTGQGHPPGVLHADAVVRLIERRIIAASGWDAAALEPHSVIRYQPGEEYLPHVDSFSPDQILVNRARGDLGGQRAVTFLLCLHAADEGGETYFHHPALAVRGEAGMGLLHYNALPDGGLDVQSLHSGRKVVRGEKWMWRSTLRENPLYPTSTERAPA
ncbi:MAG: 2OG-Fe(II) oxygenase [Proteobacteria bacterium]|nr:2OG-Fe(II) oxygenase [Pseudomonadota bacterium]